MLHNHAMLNQWYPAYHHAGAMQQGLSWLDRAMITHPLDLASASVFKVSYHPETASVSMICPISLPEPDWLIMTLTVWLCTYIVFIMLILRWYNCTGVCIVKYRQSIAFGNIYIVGHFLGSREGENGRKTSECRTSRRLSSFWPSPCVYWMSKWALSALLPRTRARNDAILEKRARIVCSVSSLWLPD